jgi:hypothetical protein
MKERAEKNGEKLRKAAYKLAREAGVEEAKYKKYEDWDQARKAANTKAWQEIQARKQLEAREARETLAIQAVARLRANYFSACDSFFVDTKRMPFPMPPSPFNNAFGLPCPNCFIQGTRLKVCHHDIKILFQGRDLWKERLRWHPDRFVRQEDNQELAKEMFQLLQWVIDNGGSRPLN